MIIRPKSPLGLKYLQIVPGDSTRGLKAGETIPLAAARPEPVDIDQFFSTFNKKTRVAIQRSQAGFGNALAGRGPQFNSAIGALRETGRKQPAGAAGDCRAEHQLRRLLAGVGGPHRPPWPRSPRQNASVFVALDRTFAAFARVSRPYIQETISKGPPTLDAAIEDLPAMRPFFRDSERFFTALQPGARALGQTSPTIDAALRAGIPALNRSPALYAQLDAHRGSAACLPELPRCLQRPRPVHRRQRTARRPRSDSSRPAQTDLQLPDARLQQPG